MGKSNPRHKIIGDIERARARYAMLCNRVENSHLPKNSCYEGVEVRVDRDEFLEWFMENNFEGCSVDRIDPNGHYDLSNMQLIPTSENIGKDKRLETDGFNRCWRCLEWKPIEDFVKCSKNKNGYDTICKPCENIRTKIRNAKRPKKSSGRY